MARYGDFDDYEFGSKRHSGPGIASCILALSAGIVELLMFGIVAFLEASNPGAFGPGSKGTAVILGGMCLGVLSSMVGVGLGIAGVSQSNRKTLFGILGLILNAVLLLGGGCLFLVLLAAGNL